jgi:flavin reductase (DIM6/NTAB) family NADH-FMN oxidoreductase RutF
MVKESKIKMECKVLEVKPLGSEGGAGNLVICEVLCMHINDEILDENNKIDQTIDTRADGQKDAQESSREG